MLEDDNLDVVCNGIVIVYLKYVIASKKMKLTGLTSPFRMVRGELVV